MSCPRTVFALALMFGIFTSEPIAAQQQPSGGRPPAPDKAAVRNAIEEADQIWGRARLSFDRAAFERLMLPEFFVELPNRRLSRSEFMEMIATPPPPGRKLKRFDAHVLTISQDGDAWVTVEEEKLEVESTTPSGGQVTWYSLFVTRNVWKQVDGHWAEASSIDLGDDSWNTRPPIAGW